MTSATYKLCLAAATGSRVDERKGILHGVSVITEGEALGHGVWIDSTTIEQVKSCLEQFPMGAKVKIDHGSGAGSIIGKLSNLLIVGSKLTADLTLIRHHERFNSIVEMARLMPESFGLSISFSGLSEEKNKRKFIRCQEVYSVDVVDFPAANPSGLFSLGRSSDSRGMLRESWTRLSAKERAVFVKNRGQVFDTAAELSAFFERNPIPSGLTTTRAVFEKMEAHSQVQFVRKGGKLI